MTVLFNSAFLPAAIAPSNMIFTVSKEAMLLLYIIVIIII